ncbi:ferredoxin [Candidatus Woesearchaeota archaeon]|nr:ferredoxin [Candidatus Woesearchaeota archaeon]
MPKYKIIYDRKNCISVGSCALLAAEFWKMNPTDDKADLVDGKQNEKQKKDEVFELEIDEKDLHQNKEAARNCPVNVIRIFDEKGKEVTL